MNVDPLSSDVIVILNQNNQFSAENSLFSLFNQQQRNITTPLPSSPILSEVYNWRRERERERQRDREGKINC